MKIQDLPLGALRPAKNNPRTHTDEQIDAVARSIRRFGWTNPVLITGDREIIAGHCRVMAARRIGLEKVPCVQLDHLSPEDVRAYVIADNELALRAGWDEELLRVELSGLKDLGYDVTLSGFATEQIDELLAATQKMGRTDENEIPDTPATPISKRGDVWIMGPHRLVCGDSTVAADVQNALGGLKPTLMVTDPPYGVEYDPAWRTDAGVGSKGAAKGKVHNDHRANWADAWRFFPGRVAYVWHGGLHAAPVANSLAAVGFGIRAQIVWIKSRPALSRGAYHWQHEPCFYAVKPGPDADGFQDGWRFHEDHALATYAVKDGGGAGWKGGRKQSTVWHIDHAANDTGHGTQKPVECMRRCILNNSAATDAVYEPFSGSGTTLIACEQTGRTFCGLEIDPVYVDVAVKRWEEFTGLKAQRQGAEAARGGRRPRAGLVLK